ncbi:MAG: hypothetical protein WBE80_15510 [Methylocella sp.]
MKKALTGISRAIILDSIMERSIKIASWVTGLLQLAIPAPDAVLTATGLPAFKPATSQYSTRLRIQRAF